MRKTTLFLAGATAFGLALAGTAAAAQQPRHGKFFDKIDINKDGAITREEARAAHARRFERLDANKDGTVSLEEFQAIAERRFARHDLNGDGRVTREEMAGAKREHHKRKAD